VIRLSHSISSLDRIAPMPHNTLRGEFAATLGGEVLRFDTTLATVARIEELCGGKTILEAVNGVVIGRRAADQIALLAAALQAMGRSAPEAGAMAARATVPEAEAFILALMGALGFKLTPRGEAGEGADPLAGMSAGDDGGASRSAA
jgi:hypothetical protein